MLGSKDRDVSTRASVITYPATALLPLKTNAKYWMVATGASGTRKEIAPGTSMETMKGASAAIDAAKRILKTASVMTVPNLGIPRLLVKISKRGYFLKNFLRKYYPLAKIDLKNAQVDFRFSPIHPEIANTRSAQKSHKPTHAQRLSPVLEIAREPERFLGVALTVTTSLLAAIRTLSIA